jgi:hypothetical protein
MEYYFINHVKYWESQGFYKAADIFTSERLKQGVDVVFAIDKNTLKIPGVYLLVHKGEIIKIGQSANLHNRINIQYKCVSNEGNNFIRKQIREKYKEVEIYVFPTSNEHVELLGYKFPINLQKGLEEAMLHELASRLV